MAYSFAAPTFFTPFRSASMTPEQRGLWKWYDGVPTPYVVIIASGVACASPGYVAPTQAQLDAADTGSGRGGKAIFIGGTTYAVTETEHGYLETAGYTVSGP